MAFGPKVAFEICLEDLGALAIIDGGGREHNSRESRLVDFERAGCSAFGVHHPLDGSEESVMDFRLIRSDRELQVDEVGDDICRCAAVNTRAGDDGKVSGRTSWVTRFCRGTTMWLAVRTGWMHRSGREMWPLLPKMRISRESTAVRIGPPLRATTPALIACMCCPRTPFAFITSILCFAWIGIKDMAGLMGCCALYAFLRGSFVSLPGSTVVSLSPALNTMGIKLGMVWRFPVADC